MTKPSTDTTRWGISLTAFWAIAVLCSFTSTASADEHRSHVVVMENAGAGSGPELAVQGLGGTVDREIPLINGFSARVPHSAVRALRGTPGVLSVYADRRFKLRSTVDAPAAPSTTLDTLRAAVGAQTVDGGPADVALVDSGVSPDASLAGHVVNGPDFSEDARVDELRNLDAFGHGTHLAGIIAAVAPQARVVNVKVAGNDGSTTLGQLLAGIDWTVRRGNRDGMNIRVLNLAFGAEPARSYRNDPLAFAVERAWDDGLTVVTSAGNGGDASESLDSPAYDPYVIAVGAEDSGGTASLADDGMALFSSRGSKTRSPDVVAPGVAILSTRVPGSFLDEAFPAARIGDGFRGSGTSQASAVVSGAAALLVGERPDLTPDQVKALLRSSARPLAATDESLQGAGVVDVADAISSPVPNARQRFPDARTGGWLRGGISNQFAVENPKGSRWSGSRWTGSRWTGSRWTGSRWTGSRWTGSRWTGSRWTGSRWTGSRWTGSRWTAVEWGGGS
ncbi:MAG: S8 family serine peptidase [Solirubrobacteraceae bacterium]